MNPAKIITALITILGLTFIVSMCNNSTSNTSEKKWSSQEAQIAATEAAAATKEATKQTNNNTEINLTNEEKEDIPFKVHSQKEYNRETQHVISLVQQKLSNIYEQNLETQYSIMCLELPIMAYNLKAFSDANPEYSDPKVSFNDVILSIEAAQKEIVGSCN